ncbi:hypothetical protein RSAG8_01237, partial [Rhizoctonia solani AG-8 WAC10335]
MARRCTKMHVFPSRDIMLDMHTPPLPYA